MGHIDWEKIARLESTLEIQRKCYKKTRDVYTISSFIKQMYFSGKIVTKKQKLAIIPACLQDIPLIKSLGIETVLMMKY